MGAKRVDDAGQVLEATILFTAQIYCDFSGYSDIARGAAYLLGGLALAAA